MAESRIASAPLEPSIVAQTATDKVLSQDRSAEVGGLDLIKATLAPLPQPQIVPVGGVDLNTAAEFIKKGAVALRVGSSLINQKLLDASDMTELTRRASAFIAEVNKGRDQKS